MCTPLSGAPASDPEKLDLGPLSCRAHQMPMVEKNSARLEQAMKHHLQETDHISSECSTLTGAITCAILPNVAAINPIERAKLGTAHTPSTLINEENCSDPPIEANIEPQDHGSNAALQDVPDGLADAQTNILDATRRPDWKLWQAACMEETNALEASATIELGIPPHDAKVVPSMVQFRLKRDEHSELNRRKARYCARGNTFTAGPDAPTAPWATVRALLSIACVNHYVVKTVDVTAAFTSVERTGLPNIWLAVPFSLGYAPGHAFQLTKTLYGFQHSPRAFYDAFSAYLITDLGFEQCTYDKMLF